MQQEEASASRQLLKGCSSKDHMHTTAKYKMQLAVTQMKWANFVVFTSHGSSSSMHVERVHYDDGFWQQALEKVITFYKKFVVLELVTRRVQRKAKLMPA